MVYVINTDGMPLMPCKEAKARKLLKQHKAQIYKYEPFTIQLLFECENQTQHITLGVDAGSKHIGLSATTQKNELYAAEIELRNDIVDLISTRRECRRARRKRLRYRKSRFLNRTHSKHKSWVAPSVEQKIQTHLRVINDIHKILPINNIIVEVANFDIQKINDPTIQKYDYQGGSQKDFWNIREYVLYRDDYTCQYCHGKSKDKILNVHHIESRKVGGDAPNNLITLCETCHKDHHNGKILLPTNIKRGKSFRDAAFMNIMKWTAYNRLNELYPNVTLTYGYLTKSVRIDYNLPKAHYIDARCISSNPGARPLGYFLRQKKVRCHNRQIHKRKFLKGGNRVRNQADYLVYGFRLFDKVKLNKKTGFVFARRISGYFRVRTLDGKINEASISYKKLRLIQTRKTLLTERVNVTI